MPKQSTFLYLIVAFCTLAIIIALIMQYQFAMEPCPLCISQRIFIILLGIAALLAALTQRSRISSRIFIALGFVFGAIGSVVAGRHVWIQNLPEDEVPLCGPGLAYMFETRPMFDALNLLFKGDGHCADVSMLFLGLSIPAWTMISFIGLMIALVFLFVRSFFQQKAHTEMSV
jgi:disulfide bond formation protein DsbB